jgi:hypothetical protein
MLLGTNVHHCEDYCAHNPGHNYQKSRSQREVKVFEQGPFSHHLLMEYNTNDNFYHYKCNLG